MSLRDLPNTEMVVLTRTWVDPGHRDRQTLQQYPLTAALLPEVEAAHQLMLATQPPPVLLKRLAAIIAAQEVLDDRHDDVLRGIWHRLQSEEYLATDPQVRAQARALREFLLPDGLAMVNQPYRQEVGFAELLAPRLTPEQTEQLAEMTTLSGNLAAHVQEWFDAADELGRLDHERNGILPEASSPSRSDASRARARWMRAVDMVRRAAAMIPDAPALDELIGRIEKAEDQAAERRNRRAARADADSGPGDGGEVTPGGDGEVTPGDGDGTAAGSPGACAPEDPPVAAPASPDVSAPALAAPDDSAPSAPDPRAP